MRTTPAALLLAAASLPVAAAPLDFTIDSDASSAAGSLGILADTDGTLIGDYDAADNPDGTQTRPGLFGGSGNNPIPVTIDADAITGLDVSPAGAFTLDADTDAGTFTMDGFGTDLLNGDTIASTIGLTLEFSTFRTIDPNFLYPGGVPLPIEIEAGQLTTVTIDQTGPMAAPGVLVETGESGVYTLAGAIPAELTLSGETFGGAPIDPEPSAITLPIAGTLTLNPDGSASVSIELDLEGFSQSVDPEQIPPLPEIPFELPTLGTETAGVLLNLMITALDLEGSGSISLVANADAAGCNAADLAEPYGVLDLADLSAFVSAFTTQSPAADIDGNGVYDLADIGQFVTAFQAGCP